VIVTLAACAAVAISVENKKVADTRPKFDVMRPQSRCAARDDITA
jgi:hypothetical protein